MAISSFRIRVRETGKPIFESIKSIEKDINKFNKTPNQFKKEVLDDVENYIDSHRKRSIEQHTEGWRLQTRRNLIAVLRLGSALFEYKDRWVLGIGEKAFLDQYAPYWYKVNYGGRIEMPNGGVYGYFDNGKSPIGGIGGGVFHATGGWRGTNPYQRGSSGRLKGKPNKGNAFLMKPMKSIPPMHYLNQMGSKINELVNQAWQTFKSMYK